MSHGQRSLNWALALRPEEIAFRPEDVFEDMVLGGPDRREIEIWEGFGKAFDRVLKEMSGELGLDDPDGTPFQAVSSPFRTWINATLADHPAVLRSTGQDETVIVPIDMGDLSGMAALMRTANDDYRMVGVLHGCDLAVDPLYRGLGIGRAIIAAELLTEACLPTWDHDTPGYTPAGEATVLAGLRLARALAPSEPALETEEAPSCP